MLPVADVIPSRTTPWMTIGLIAISTAVFLLAWSFPIADASAWMLRLAFVPVGPSWTTATAALFLHENALHLALNVMVLWIFGDNVEDQLGHLRFLALYLVSAYAGWAAALWATPQSTVPLVGAGGPIAGVLGAYFVMFPRSRVLALVPARSIVDAIELPAVVLAAAWFSLQAVVGLGRLDVPFRGLTAALWPFVGGAVAGMLTVRVARRPERRRVEWWGH
jgi:membrane associated rhomboid family serine protease